MSVSLFVGTSTRWYRGGSLETAVVAVGSLDPDDSTRIDAGCLGSENALIDPGRIRREKALGMAQKIINLVEARSRLSQLVERAAAGETIVIAKAGRPLARLVPMPRNRPVRLGSLRGRITIPADFDRLGDAEIEAMFDPR